jgi:hypothetical protein
MKTRILGILLIIALVTSLMGITASAAGCNDCPCCECNPEDCNCNSYGPSNGGQNGHNYAYGPCCCDSEDGEE